MKTENILEKYIAPNDKLISWREIDNEVLMLQKEEKAIYELNDTGNLIWKEAVKKKKVADIIKILQKKYKKVDKGTLRKDALNFIGSLLEKNLFVFKK